MEIGTTSVRLLRVLEAAAKNRGLDAAAIFAGAGIATDLLADEEARVPRSLEHQVWSAIAIGAGDSDFGLHLAEQQASSGAFGVLEYVIRTSPSLRDACRRVTRFLPVLFVGDAIVEGPVRGGHRFGYARGPGGPPLSRHPEECAVAGFVLLAREMLGRRLLPAEVAFEHAAPASTVEHDRLFGCPLRFGADYNGVVLSPDVLDEPVVRADPNLSTIVEALAEKLLASLPSAPPLVDEVRRWVANKEGLDGELTVQRAARALGTSARSLQRRLGDDGTSFSAIVDDVRKGVALRGLEQGSLNVAEIAALAGFSDQNTFYRAFKRWTGVSPTDYKRRFHPR